MKKPTEPADIPAYWLNGVAVPSSEVFCVSAQPEGDGLVRIRGKIIKVHNPRITGESETITIKRG